MKMYTPKKEEPKENFSDENHKLIKWAHYEE
jgi:hypothetical protein